MRESAALTRGKIKPDQAATGPLLSSAALTLWMLPLS
jgi:hypothetical protein